MLLGQQDDRSIIHHILGGFPPYLPRVPENADGALYTCIGCQDSTVLIGVLSRQAKPMSMKVREK